VQRRQPEFIRSEALIVLQTGFNGLISFIASSVDRTTEGAKHASSDVQWYFLC
jgi:hypothetical protein